jgi:hypothetical protein
MGSARAALKKEFRLWLKKHGGDMCSVGPIRQGDNRERRKRRPKPDKHKDHRR